MKKASFVFFVFALVTSSCFAEEGLAPSGAANFIGIVDSISNRDSVSGAKPQIIVKDGSGKGTGTTFMVASDAIIMSKVGHAANLDWVNRGDEVTVTYITAKDGARIAKYIKVSDSW